METTGYYLEVRLFMLMINKLKPFLFFNWKMRVFPYCKRNLKLVFQTDKKNSITIKTNSPHLFKKIMQFSAALEMISSLKKSQTHSDLYLRKLFALTTMLLKGTREKNSEKKKYSLM